MKRISNYTKYNGNDYDQVAVFLRIVVVVFQYFHFNNAFFEPIQFLSVKNRKGPGKFCLNYKT